MSEKPKPMSGWKVKTGTITAIVGTAVVSSSGVFTDPTIIMWTSFIGKLLISVGGGFVSWGFGHKMEKNKEAIQNAISSGSIVSEMKDKSKS